MAKTSQLKRLKETLKKNDLTGQTNVKGNKKKTATGKNRQDRDRVLADIRQQFNPFDVKVAKKKHDIGGRNVRGSVGRPGLSKLSGEEARMEARKLEMQNKGRVGGVFDRRFGENDSNMTPEEKMQERFTRERQLRSMGGGRNKSIFALDDDEDDAEMMLTHSGQALDFKDDFDQGDLGLDEEEDEEMAAILANRRKLAEQRGMGAMGVNLEEMDGVDMEEEGTGRKKSKEEVMKEIIAKSKFHKAERQAARDKDAAIIDEMNDEDTMNALIRELGSIKAKKVVTALDQKEREYDENFRNMILDRRAKPLDRTKTDEELAAEEAEKLKKLEDERQARMRGEVAVDQGEGDDLDGNVAFDFENSSADEDDEEEEAEDDDDEDVEIHEVDDEEEDEEDDSEVDEKSEKPTQTKSADIAYTFPIPKSHKAFLETTEAYPLDQLPTIIDRINVLHHASLKEGNKERLAKFACVLIDHLMYLADEEEDDDFASLSEVVSKVHTLAETHSPTMAAHIRKKLEAHEADTPVTAGHLMLWTLIGMIFSTSDHFHLVVTPAVLVMTRFLSLSTFDSVPKCIAGLYTAQLLIQYQRIAKRFIPEIAVFLGRLIAALEGTETSLPMSSLFKIAPIKDFAPGKTSDKQPLSMRSANRSILSKKEVATLSQELHDQAVFAVSKLMDTYKDVSAFPETFEFCEEIPELADKYERISKFKLQDRKPLTLHKHRPLALKTMAPKFEENFNVDKKSYNPDMALQETQKLRAELKKEKKSALREIRKDAAFEAREKIRERREKDDAYHEKMARLVRSVQTEEGAEKNAYERERASRKRKR
ncbi:putative nucleolar complex protein 14 [Yarrowia sp. B02]|nr:putative nucleolar complex protein 14 [Yarrowia sp. B02]